MISARKEKSKDKRNNYFSKCSNNKYPPPPQTINFIFQIREKNKRKIEKGKKEIETITQRPKPSFMAPILEEKIGKDKSWMDDL